MRRADHDLQELRRTKMTVLGLVFVLAGILLTALARWISSLSLSEWSWLQALPMAEVGGSLFAIGIVGIAYDHYTRRHEEDAATRRLRSTLRREAPVMRDAVIRAFAFKPEDLERVATPAVLDRLVTNSLALRFGDPAFAREVYTDLLEQAITAPERWHDARVSIDLAIARGNTSGVTPSFDVVVRWEYTVTPRHQFRRFAVVSDRHRYDELAAEGRETSVWFKPARSGMSITDPESFRVVQFTVDGRECELTRHVDDSAQTYVADLGTDVIANAKPVVVSFTYVTRVAQAGHLLHIDIDRPTRGIDVEITYDSCGVAEMRLLDFISSGRTGRIPEQSPDTGQQVLRFGYDGWVLPRAGLTFVWTLESERSTERRTVRRAA